MKSQWRMLGLGIVVLMMLILVQLFGESVEIAGVDVPLWLVTFVSYILGACALYAQLRGEDKIVPSRKVT